MPINIDKIKTLLLPDSLVTPDKDGQPGWGMYNDGYNIYELIEAVVDDLNVGTSTLVSNTLVDNLNGTYTWTPIVGASFLINTHASSNPINTILGLTATTVQDALQQLYTAVSTNGGFTHPAVTLDVRNNPAFNLDLVTQVAYLDLSNVNSVTHASILPEALGGWSIEDWMITMEGYVTNFSALGGVGNTSDLGTFVGTIITDNVSIKQALQELENALTAANVASTSTYVDNLDGTWNLDNNSLTSPSATLIDTRADVLPLAPNLSFDIIPTTHGGLPTSVITFTVQEALEQLLACCDTGKVTIGPTTTGTTTTATLATSGIRMNSGLGIIPDDVTIIDSLVYLEAAVANRKPITTSVATNPALTIDTIAPLVDKIVLDLNIPGSYTPGTNVLVTPTNIEGALTAIDAELVKTRVSLIGVGATDNDLGAFTGSTITTGNNVKGALQEVVTSLEAVSHTTSIITDNANGTYTHNNGLGVLNIIDTNALSSGLSVLGITATNTQAGIAELLTLSQTIQTALGTVTSNLGAFTGGIIAPNLSVKQALQQLETTIEGGIITAVDNGLTLTGSLLELGGTLNQITDIDTTGYSWTIGASDVRFHVEDTYSRMAGTAVSITTGAEIIVLDSNFSGGYSGTGGVLQNTDKNTGETKFTPYQLPLVDGTINQSLTTNGTGALSWTSTGAYVTQIAFVDSPYTASWGDDLEVDCTAGNVIINYPSAASFNGRTISALRVDASVNTITVNPFGAETLNGAPNDTISSQWDILLVKSNGTNLTKR